MSEGPSEYNSAKYDGYIYYQEMGWKKLSMPNEVSTGRGLLQSIPGTNQYTGWVCHYNGEGQEDAERYSCKAVVVPKADVLNNDSSVDLRS